LGNTVIPHTKPLHVMRGFPLAEDKSMTRLIIGTSAM
jgi:hypothetical protein